MKAFRKAKDRGFTIQTDIILGILLKHCSCILLNFSIRAGIVGFTHRQLHRPEKTLFLPRKCKMLGSPENPLLFTVAMTEILPHRRHSTGFQVRVRLLQ